MSLDAMKKVAEAEASAKQALLDANNRAKQAAADAETAGRAAYDAKMAQADADVAALMRSAEETAKKNAEEIMQHAENQCAVLRVHAESRLSEAADRIVERIVMR